MVPFLIDMSVLFETFVAEWLMAHQPRQGRFRDHRKFTWDATHGLRSDIDLVLYDEVGSVACVLDTKYKRDGSPGEADIHQIVFYAQAMGCHEAVLVYPTALTRAVDSWVKDIHVRTMSFAIGGDLDSAGGEFLAELFSGMTCSA